MLHGHMITVNINKTSNTLRLKNFFNGKHHVIFTQADTKKKKPQRKTKSGSAVHSYWVVSLSKLPETGQSEEG